MPSRIIKESITFSGDFNELSWFEQAVFTRLIVICDDYGRTDARLALLKARLFPLVSVTEKQIGAALNKISTVGMVRLYEVDGGSFLQLESWGKHQQIRNKKSKFPAPDINCNQSISNVTVIQSESESESESEPAWDAEIAFPLFWDKYPRKASKKDAATAWKKEVRSEEIFNRLMTILEEFKGSREWKKDNGQFIPYPATWINGRRWEDELSPARPGPPDYNPQMDFFAETEDDDGV